MTLPETPSPSEERKEPTGRPELDDLPEGFTPLVRPVDSPARRRRLRRSLLPPGEDERAALAEDLARRAFPSIEFYLFAFLSGILLGAGYLLDSDALLLLGLLLAPLLTPWVGLALATTTGSLRFFLQTLTSLLLALALTFLTSSLVGSFNRAFELTKFQRASDHALLWWTDLAIVVLGAVLLALAFVRGERRPILPSVMVAYGLFLPVGAAGFGLGSGLEATWPNGLYILLTHLALATLAGIITLLALRFRPRRLAGYLLLVFITLLCLAALATFTGLAGLVLTGFETPEAGEMPTVSALASPTRGLPPSATPGEPTATHTLLPSKTPSPTITETPAPSYANILADTGGGANVRSEPAAGDLLTTLINGTLVEVLPEMEAVGGISWRHVRTAEGLEGWVLQSVLVPAPAVTP